MSKYTDEEYLKGVSTLFNDGDAEIDNYKCKVVTTRKEHPCAAWGAVTGREEHSIPAGSRCVSERAIVEGKPGSAYSCFECIDVWLDEVGRYL